MKDYREFTFGWLTFVFAIPIHVLLTYWFINSIGDRPLSTSVYIVITTTFLIIYLLFYGLTTKITFNAITISFGIGLIRRRIELRRIKSVETVKSPWYYGWGIRIIPKGILYNTSGSDGVEIKFNDHDRIIRVGTKDSPTLKKEIEKRLLE